MQKTMTKVVYNDTFGMPKLSREAIAWMKARGYRGKFSDARGELAVPRHHPLLVACIEELGEAADWSIGGCGSRFRVAEVEGDSYYVIPYDMREAVIGEKDLVSTRGKDALFVESFDHAHGRHEGRPCGPVSRAHGR